MSAPPAPISPEPDAGFGLNDVGGFDSASTAPPRGMFAPARLPAEPGPPPVGGPGSDIAEGGPAGRRCEEVLGANRVLAVRLTIAASAKTVFPTSPRTNQLARNGISAIAIDNSNLTAPNRINWLDPTNALRTLFPPSTTFTLFICNAVINTCRIAYSSPQL